LPWAWKIDKWGLIPEGMSRINNIRRGFNIYWQLWYNSSSFVRKFTS
jgi:hypothetical protein